MQMANKSRVFYSILLKNSTHVFKPLLLLTLLLLSCGKDASSGTSLNLRRMPENTKESSGINLPTQINANIKTLTQEPPNTHPNAMSHATKLILDVIPSVATCSGKEILPARLWRLSESQYINTISDIFGQTAANLFPKLGEKGVKASFPSSGQSLAVSAAFVAKMIPAGEALSAYAVAQIPDIKNCAASVQDSMCLANIITNYGHKLWRRPLQKAETDKLLGAAASLISAGATRTEAHRAILETLIHSPHFWYRSELGSSAGAPAGRVKLNDYEVASFLAYTVWDGPPDDALYALAAAGTLANQAGVQKAMERMLKDSKSARGLIGFFDEWTGYSGVENVPKSAELSVILDAPTREALKLETDQFIREFAFAQNMLAKDFFSSSDTFLNNTSASFYGMPAAASGSQFVKVSLPPEKRAGPFTQASFLAAQSGLGSTSLSHRGNFVLKETLCKEMKKPDGIADATEADNSLDLAKLTNRQIFEKLHSSKPACASCHKILDPAGASLENFDPIGRFRTTEKGGLVIDSSGSFVDLGDASVAFQTGVDLYRALAGTERFQSCLVKKYSQNVFGQVPEEKFSCEVAKLNEVFLADKKMGSLAKGISDIESVLFRSIP